MSEQGQHEVSEMMKQLSAYMAAAARKPLPAAVAEKTKHHIADTLAAMISGARLLPGRRAIDFVKTQGGAKEASVMGGKLLYEQRVRMRVSDQTERAVQFVGAGEGNIKRCDA